MGYFVGKFWRKGQMPILTVEVMTTLVSAPFFFHKKNKINKLKSTNRQHVTFLLYTQIVNLNQEKC